MPRALDLTGQRFGRLVATVPELRGEGVRRWRCVCDCGGAAIVPAAVLRNGNTSSCGCLHREMVSRLGKASVHHGHTAGNKESPTFCSWKSMMQRAHAGTSKDAKRYLHRGITVCARWQTFKNFLSDMGERPDGMTIDRIDNALGYEPANCRWATAREQAQNRKKARMVTAFGETLNVAEWARRLGMSRQTLRHRLEAGWSPEDAVKTKLDPGNRWNRSITRSDERKSHGADDCA